MENPDSEELLEVLLRWARAVRIAGRLLLAANPLADTRIPKEEYLTEWSSISEVPGLFGVRRSAGIRLIDESVKQLLESPEDPRRLLRVLASIRSWRLTKPDFNASKRADAVRGLEQRVIYEMGASWARSPAADARGSGSAAHSPEFLHALTSEVNAWLHSGQLAWNRQPGVNGQVRVAAGGQVKVPAPWLLLPGFRGWGTSLGAGLAHAERLSFGDHDDGVVQEAVEEADGGGVLGQEPSPLVEGPV